MCREHFLGRPEEEQKWRGEASYGDSVGLLLRFPEARATAI